MVLSNIKIKNILNIKNIPYKFDKKNTYKQKNIMRPNVDMIVSNMNKFDIEDPKSVLNGNDPQLERAVKEALKLLKINAFKMKPEPAGPIRWKRPDGYKNEE